MSNGRIPQEVIDAVLKHHDIVDVVGKHVHLTRQGRYLKGLCPFHSEKTPSFTVTPEKQIFYCYGCGAGGGTIKFVMQIEGCSFAEAVRQLAEEAHIPITWDDRPQEPTEEQLERANLYEAHEHAAKLYHYILINTGEGKKAVDYLRRRGFTDKAIETFQIGYAPAGWDTLTQFLRRRGFELPLMEKGGLVASRSEGAGYIDRFRDRVMFPIRDAKGKVIAFAGRALGDVQPKYLNSPESPLFNKSRNLYNLHLARPAIRKQRQLVLFEGYADVIKAWEAGVANGVATMGTALTEEHAAVIKRNADQVIVCYDGDDAGQSAAFKSIAILEGAGCRVKVAMIPDRLDPDEYIERYGSDRFVRDVIESAVTSVKYKLVYTKKNFRLQDDDGKLRYIRHALGIIAEIPAPTEREHYLKELGSEFDYSFETLKQEMNQIRQQLQKIRANGDNMAIPWNNAMNGGGRSAERAPSLLPAYHNAERKLLEVMMHDREVALMVQERIDDQFNDETHAALAAYLYAYYALGNEPDVSKFIATLQDERLESAASSISMMDTFQGATEQVIEDYIQIITGYRRQMRTIRQKKEELIRAERSGEAVLAAQIGKEIITLERQLKSL